MSSIPGSKTRSAEAVGRATVIVPDERPAVGDALERLERVAGEAGVELVDDAAGGDAPELAVVLGGDGTMLRALKRFLGTGVPVIGVNFGTVGFLTSIPANELEAGVARAFAGGYEVVELRTLEVESQSERHVAVNDVVLRSSVLGRMIELSWALGGEDLGRVRCDGVICATPAGSTAYNLSNGGPVLVWGLEAMAVSFLAPHSLHIRPLVVPQGRDLTVANCTPDVEAALLVDGQAAGSIGAGESAVVRVDDQASLLATLPEATFFRRYRNVFAH
jgi:NAD+ kinase